MPEIGRARWRWRGLARSSEVWDISDIQMLPRAAVLIPALGPRAAIDIDEYRQIAKLPGLQTPVALGGRKIPQRLWRTAMLGS